MVEAVSGCQNARTMDALSLLLVAFWFSARCLKFSKPPCRSRSAKISDDSRLRNFKKEKESHGKSGFPLFNLPDLLGKHPISARRHSEISAAEDQRCQFVQRLSSMAIDLSPETSGCLVLTKRRI